VAIHIERRAYSDLTQPWSFRRICPQRAEAASDVILVDMRKQPNGTSGKKPAAPSVKVRPGHAE
jgi:hypothetical protein